jgi:hypothetical protein
MNKEQFLGVIRHIITAVGMVGVVKGYLDEASLTLIIGAIITAASGIWSIFDKTEAQTQKKVESFQAKQEKTKKFTSNI